MEKPILTDNNTRFLELILQDVKRISPKALFDINYFPSSVRVSIQSEEQFRGRIFNKLYHIHKVYGLNFTPTQFIKRDKNIITFDLLL